MIKLLEHILKKDDKMLEKNYEIRSFESKLEITPESRNVVGYALLFNVESKNLGGFNEIIDRNALTEDILLNSDIYCVINHDVSKGLLARSKYGKGSLNLFIDDIGLRYEFEAPKTALGDELIEALKRDDITESSFGFSVEKEELQERDGKLPLVIIKKFRKLYDVSPVYNPAYEGTEVSVRSLVYEEYVENKRQLELVDYYKKLREQL